MSRGAGAPSGRGTAAARKKDPTLIEELPRAVESETGGDPEGKRRFVRTSLRNLAVWFRRRASHSTIGRLLRPLKFSRKTNVKRLTGPAHPDRDRQFRWIKKVRALFLRHGAPVISTDTKNSVLIGNFKNAGAQWCRQAEQVLAHDFPGDAECRAVPYGVYDVGRNRGHVCVSLSKDSSELAVNSIRDWWRRTGRRNFAGHQRLLILADSGGSNSCRVRLWKRELPRFADETGLTITVAHFPRGASKWNPVEHRLFGPIRQNRRGVPLRTLDTLLGYIRHTTTRSGLKVTAKRDRRNYQQKIKVKDREMKQLKLRRQRTCPLWNCSLSPSNHLPTPGSN